MIKGKDASYLSANSIQLDLPTSIALQITPSFYPLPVLDLAKGPKKKCCKKYKKKGKKRCNRCPGRHHN